MRRWQTCAGGVGAGRGSQRREMQVANWELGADRPSIIAELGSLQAWKANFLMVRPVLWMRGFFVDVIDRD